MSRSDRIVNILLALAWVLLIVRVGRIYMEGTSAEVSSAEVYDDAVPSPIVLVRHVPSCRVARRAARARHANTKLAPPSAAHADVHHGPAGVAAHRRQVPLFSRFRRLAEV